MRTGAAVWFFAGVVLLGGLFLSGLASPAPKLPPEANKSRLRRPTALVFADAGAWLFVANRRSGSITIIDTSTSEVTAEVTVGRSLADLTLSPDGHHMLAVDEDARELILLSRRGPVLKVVHRLPVAPMPVSVRVVDNARCFVALLWAHQIVEVDLKAVPPRVTRVVPLPFAPREQLLVSDAKLVVADAFGGRLAVVDINRGKVDSVRTLPAHNIRGLALCHDGQELWVAHQLLNGRAAATFDDVHWGNLMTNNVRVLRLNDLLNLQADVLRASRLHYLGDVGHAAGDPAQIAVSQDGTGVVALAGVGEIALHREKSHSWQRVTVGRRPTAVAISPDGGRAYVANQFTDSLSIVDLKKREVTAELALGPRPELSSIDRGELLFYDARLAHDGWMSCHSCHTDGHTNGLLADTLGDGSVGTPKRVLSLLGVRDTAPYAWNGSMADLDSQVRKSILTTMHGNKPSEQQVADLAAYLRTLPPPPHAQR